MQPYKDNMNINPEKLSKELIAAGISSHGNCNSAGIVWDDNNNEIQNLPEVQAVLITHNANGKTWDEIRIERAKLFAACDWTQLNDAILSIEEKTAWQEYRQALRDITQAFATPNDVIWPIAPGVQQ